MKSICAAKSRPSISFIRAALPDFQLTDQHGRTIRAADLRGKVTAIDFIYSRCPLPDVCPRLSAHFALLHPPLPGVSAAVLLLLSVPVSGLAGKVALEQGE